VAIITLTFFHGIGGFALGASWAGMKFNNHFCSDIEPYAQELYKLRFPDSIQLGDITKIDTEELKKYGDKWIISGGFPCQDISIAGKGAGIHGERSGLWFEYWRLINDLRPRFAIIENVAMLTNRGLDVVLSNLAEIGYDAEWQDIRAEDVGAPHRRERIWIVAYPAWDGRREKRTREPTASGEEESALGNERQGVGMGERTQPAGGDNEGLTEVADTEGTECERKRRASRRWRSELGCSGGWAVEPDVGRVAYGVANRVDRLKAIGNGQVPRVVATAFNLLK